MTFVDNPSLVIVVGTYDGVLAGWETQDGDGRSLELTFATPVHQGSIRSLCMAAPPPARTSRHDDGHDSTTKQAPGTLLSCGYDEDLKTHEWSKKLHSSGQARTPADFGTPTCSSFAPPPPSPVRSTTTTTRTSLSSTHCLLGFSGGKLVVYKKRDWSIQHVLTGHEGGMASMAVHPSGKLALTGGRTDGKIKLWDLTRGRLAYATKVSPSSSSSTTSKRRQEPVDSLTWSAEGNMYGWCCGNRVTVRTTDTGKDLLDAELPSRVNEIAIMEGPDGTFVAAACNDGSLPVLAVQAVASDDSTEERRATLAIEPVDNPVAGEERFKCIRTMSGYRVVTCNSAGVVSVMNLEGAVRMILSGSAKEEDEDDDDEEDSNDGNDDDDEELAVDIVESVRLGSGARITCLCVWYNADNSDSIQNHSEPLAMEKEEGVVPQEKSQPATNRGTKRRAEVEMDSAAIEKARSLVKQAKRMKKKKDRKKKRAQTERVT